MCAADVCMYVCMMGKVGRMTMVMGLPRCWGLSRGAVADESVPEHRDVLWRGLGWKLEHYIHVGARTVV